MSVVTRSSHRRPRTTRGSDARAAWLFLSPWVVGLLVFTAFPVVATIALSFTEYDVINAPRAAGLENYERLVADDKVLLALRNTAVFALLSVPAKVVLSFVLAVLLLRAGRAQGWLRTAFFLPRMTPPVAVGVLLLLLLNGQSGVLNQVLGWVGIEGPSWTTDPTWVKPGLAVMSLWTIGGGVVIIMAALARVPQEMYDAARLDGARWWSQVRHVTLPMTSGAVFFLVVVDTIGAFQTFTEAYTAYFGAGNGTYGNDAALFYSIYLFQQAFEFLRMGYASALALVLFVVVMAVTGVQLLVSRRLVYYEADR